MLDEIEILRQGRTDGITHFSTGVAAVRDGKILLVRRVSGDHLGGMFELPGGGVDEGETMVAAAIRELREETGLETKRIIGTLKGFDYTTPKKPKVRQTNFLVEVEDGDVVLLPEEHDDYIWINNKSELAGLKLTDQMKQCVEAALREL